MTSSDVVPSCEQSKPDPNFTFEWEIKNLRMLATRRWISYLDSPIFHIGVLKNSTWYLRLVTDSFNKPTCMLCRSDNLPVNFELKARIKIFPSSHLDYSYCQNLDHIFLDSLSSVILFKNFTVMRNPGDYQIPTDWPEPVTVKFTVWKLPYVGLTEIKRIPYQAKSYDWQDFLWMSSSMDEKPVRTYRPHTCRGNTQVDVFEKTLTWTIERFLTRKPELKRSLFLEGNLGDQCPLILTLYVSQESGTKGDLIVELRRDNQRVIEISLVKCRIIAKGRSKELTIFPKTIHLFDSGDAWVLRTILNFNTETRKDEFLSENGALTLRFEIGLSLENAQHLTKSTWFLWRRSPLDPVQDFTKAMRMLFDNQDLQTYFDVKLQSEDGRIFKCHKNVLAARSVVFANRFQMDTTEAIQTYATDGIQTDATDEIQTEATDGLQTEVTDGIQTEVTDGIQTDVADGIQTDVADGIQMDVTVRSKTDVIELLLIDDMPSVTLKRLLHFVYAAVLERLDLDSLLRLYLAASAYKVSSLMESCVDRLKWMVTKDNIGLIREVAGQCEDKTLASWAEREDTNLQQL